MTFLKRIWTISSKNTWKEIYLLELVPFFIGPNLAASIPQALKHFSSFLPKQKSAGSFVFKPFLYSYWNWSWNPRLHFGPTRILKCASKIIPSMETYQQVTDSIEIGSYLSKLKHANVVWIYKREHKTDPSNYRPISLLFVYDSIFAKTIYRRLMAYLEINDIVCSSQYGFRKKHSTEHALIDIVNQIQSHFDKGKLSCGVFID